MTPEVVRQIRGIVHCWEPQFLIRSVGRRIDISRDNGQSFEMLGRLNLGTTRNIASVTKLGCRLTRANTKHCLRLSDDLLLIFAGKWIFHANTGTKTIKPISQYHGSRPLRICFDGNSVFYGEYRFNSERSPISIWRSDDLGFSWQKAHTFSNVRHVHGVYRDPLDSSIWVTTGDYEQEAALWRTKDDFKTLVPVIQGSQQTRAIDLVFFPDQIVFGSDAPDERNWIYRLDRSTSKVEKIQEVKGPVFHGKHYFERAFFSTSREPSEVNQFPVEVWMYSDGQLERIATFKKDIWSMKYFQYGQVCFPEGIGQQNQLWLSPFATEKDQTSMLLNLPHEPTD